MSPAGQQNGLDGRMIAHLVGLIDSPVDAEAAGALHKIRVLKKKHGDIPFYEVIERPDYKAAIWEKFGQPECLREYFERENGGQEAQLTEAREKAATYAREAKDAMAKVTHYAEIVSQLRQELSARPARASSVSSSSDSGLVNGGLVAVVVLVALALMIAAVCQ